MRNKQELIEFPFLPVILTFSSMFLFNFQPFLEPFLKLTIMIMNHVVSVGYSDKFLMFLIPYSLVSSQAFHDVVTNDCFQFLILDVIAQSTELVTK